MHMADALLSPSIGVGFWVASATAIVVAARRMQQEPLTIFERRGVTHSGNAEQAGMPKLAGTPALAGVLAAFIFAAQMINFSIPGTGSSGHLAGGILLGMLLGPWAGLIAMTSVLLVQALFFADGGILALGCNVWNIGVVPCLLVAPMIRRIPGISRSPRHLAGAAAIGAFCSVSLGAFMVVIQTVLSGKAELPFPLFAPLMMGIHAAIGLVEALVTGVILAAVYRSRPVALNLPDSRRTLIAPFAVASLMIGTVIAWASSESPDGLEWSLERAQGGAAALVDQASWTHALTRFQEHVALLPNYTFPGDHSNPIVLLMGTSASGLVGLALTILLVVSALTLIRLWKADS